MEKPKIDQMITFIHVTDLFDSQEFYEGIMGFPLRLDQGECRIVETNQRGGGLLGYCARDDQISELGGDFIITLVTSFVDEWYEYLSSSGVNIPEPPCYNQKYNIYHFFFNDPDGYQLEIQEFRDPDW